MKVVVQEEGLKFKKSLRSKRGYPIKFLLSYPRLVIIGFLTLVLKREEVLVHQGKIVLVESVAKRIWVRV